MKYTIKHFQAEFPNDDACLEYIFNLKYGKDYVCKECGKGKYYRVKKRKCYACSICGHQLHPTANTIFHKSATKLTLWFFAIYLASQCKNGVSAKELERQLGVTYKCAWRVSRKIRELMKNEGGKLNGIVEVDEAYIGGKGKNKIRGRGADKKTPIVGMAQRKGRMIAKQTDDVKSFTIMPLVRENVKIGTKLMTDEFCIYDKARQSGYIHKRIRHASKEYVRGDVHTNSVEGFWSQLKRSIHGTYHSVSPKYLQSYLDEFAYRYNQRHSLVPTFYLLLARLV